MTTLPLASRAASAGPDRACACVNAAASSAPVSMARRRRIARAPPTALDSQPGRLRRKPAAPARDVEDRYRVIGDGVANGDAGADPFVKAPAPVLGAVDQHRAGGLECGAHAVRPGRPFRPARPRCHVALPRPAQRVLVAVNRQDPAPAVGDRDHAADALDLGRDRRRGAAELGEHDPVLERVLGRRLLGCGRGRRLGQGGVDVVLLATAIPRRGHFGSYPPNAVVPGEKTLSRRGHRLVPLRVTHAMTPCGLAHVRTVVYAGTAALCGIRRARPTRRRDPSARPGAAHV